MGTQDKGFFEFKGKMPMVLLISVITSFCGGGIKLYSLCERVEGLQKQVDSLQCKSDKFLEALPRIESNLAFTKETLAEIKQDIKDKGKK